VIIAGTVLFRLVTATDEQPRRWTGLSRTAEGRPVPSAAERARSAVAGLRPSDRAVGWLAPIGVTLLAFALRMYHLGTPKRFAFDETYYAKDAWSLINNGYAQTYLSDVDGNTANKIDDDISRATPTTSGPATRRWSCTPRSASG
jgi:dolichyl-phosphate-mannose-protein mannosyltransferase